MDEFMRPSSKTFRIVLALLICSVASASHAVTVPHWEDMPLACTPSRAKMWIPGKDEDAQAPCHCPPTEMCPTGAANSSDFIHNDKLPASLTLKCCSKPVCAAGTLLEGQPLPADGDCNQTKPCPFGFARGTYTGPFQMFEFGGARGPSLGTITIEGACLPVCVDEVQHANNIYNKQAAQRIQIADADLGGRHRAQYALLRQRGRDMEDGGDGGDGGGYYYPVPDPNPNPSPDPNPEPSPNPNPVPEPSPNPNPNPNPNPAPAAPSVDAGNYIVMRNESGQSFGLLSDVWPTEGVSFTRVDHATAGDIVIACETGVTTNDCLGGSSLVTLASGKKVAIETLKPGDTITGPSGDVVVSSVNHLAAKTDFYRINNFKFLITGEHPVQTTKGWKSANYTARYKGTIGRLEVGDVLVTKDGEVPISSIDFVGGKGAGKSVNVQVQGDVPFYVDGVAVKPFKELQFKY
jgi:hypothetical protein